jgi:hypothetical protein
MVLPNWPGKKQETPTKHSLFYELNFKINQSKHAYFELNSFKGNAVARQHAAKTMQAEKLAVFKFLRMN